MKRIIFIIIIICILVLLGYFLLKPAVLFLARQQLEKVFVDSVVEIADCDIKPFHKLDLLNIRIKKEPVYDFRVGGLRIQFTPYSILKGIILRASLSNAAITINQPGKSIQNFKQQLKYGNSKAGFVLDSIELSDIKLNLNSKEVIVDAALSLVFDLKNLSLYSCNLKIDSLSSSGLQLSNFFLDFSRAQPFGVCSVDQITYSDVKIREIKGRAKLEKNSLILDDLSAQTLRGIIQGSASLSLDRDKRYKANLQFANLDLATIVNDFKLGEKVQLQGNLSGLFILEGSGLSIGLLGADMSAGQGGGALTIKDYDYLNNLARSTNQSLDLIVESFKNYRYNAGVMKLYLEGTDLVFDIKLEGESGKRDLIIILHDFKKTKEE